MNHDMITDQMIAIVNRNADIRDFERRLQAISARRKRKSKPPRSWNLRKRQSQI